MDNVNAPISYTWRFGWSSKEEPKVNPLIKAILEKNVGEMESLFNLGASIDETDFPTLERALYFVVDNYPVMKCLVNHGFSIIDNFVRYSIGLTCNKLSADCVSPEGCTSGMSGRAYYLGAYDVFELLVAQGFDSFHCYEKGWKNARHLDKEIFMTQNERGIRILLEHSYDVPIEYYQDIILNRPQVPRKSIALDSAKFSKRKHTYSEEDVPLLFGRKDAIRRNSRRKEDYYDWLRAYNEFKSSIGEACFAVCQEQEIKDNEIASQILHRLLKRS